MKRLFTAAEAREADRLTIANGMASDVLMERAALSVLQTMMKQGYPLEHVLIAAGTGNNAGDGIAIARMLCEMGYSPTVLLAGDSGRFSDQMRHQLALLSWYQPSFAETYEPGRWEVVVDALFGVGLSREITGAYRDLIEAINQDDAARVVAVDIPSGINADSGEVCGCAVRADDTVTFAFGKPGLFLFPGAEYSGRVVISPIGIPEPQLFSAPRHSEQPSLRFTDRFLLEPEDLRQLPGRKPDGNKGSYKKILVIAGSREICGAACLSARACLMAGAGMVRILTEESNRVPLAAAFPEALISVWKAGSLDPSVFQSCMDWADGILAGPGIGTDEDAEALLRWSLASGGKPTVLDADALNLLARQPSLWKEVHANCVLTPHLAEMARLTGKPVPRLRKTIFESAEEFALRHGVICVLKDARTVTAYPDGKSYLTVSGNSALATAGSGDVLAGMTAALFTQYQDSAIPAAALADLAHAMAGTAASEQDSERTVTASRILDFLPRIL